MKGECLILLAIPHICSRMDLEIRKSNIPGAGKGLFAKRLFRRGERVVEYEGEVITWAQCRKRNEKMEGVGAYYFYISNRKCVDAQNTLEAFARYANDAAGLVRLPGIRNNARYEVYRGKPYIVASRNIPEGEEIFVSYGKEYWQAMRENHYDPTKPKKHTGKFDPTEPHPVPKREAKQ